MSIFNFLKNMKNLSKTMIDLSEDIEIISLDDTTPKVFTASLLTISFVIKESLVSIFN